VQLWQLPKIVIAPDALFPGNPALSWFTNTFLGTWVVIILLVIIFAVSLRRKLIPSGMQNAVEWIFEALQRLVAGVAGEEKGKRFFPYVFTFFIFILFANLIDVIPGVDTVGQAEHNFGTFFLTSAASNQIIPWIRPATTDLNLTLAMALVSVVVTQFFGFSTLGAGRHLSKYFNVKALITNGPLGIVDFIVGLLEIISELGRLISFSFRLFGNVFAGSVLLAVFAFLLPVVATIIFIPFEIFVGAIQAFVFAFLTLIFMELGTTSHQEGDEGDHEALQEYHQNERQEQQHTAVAH
jgi:F-type H+-transporting ATPase subunit a